MPTIKVEIPSGQYCNGCTYCNQFNDSYFIYNKRLKTNWENRDHSDFKYVIYKCDKCLVENGE